MQRGIAQFASILLVLSLYGCSWFGSDSDEESRDPYPLGKVIGTSTNDWCRQLMPAGSLQQVRMAK
jgi:hypothetical protein